MDNSLNVTNVSSETPIFVRMRPPEDGNIPSPSDSPISPGATEKMAVRDGTMNMFVWTDPSDSPIWKGIIPTKVKNNVVISRENGKVLYDGVEIPNGFKPVTDVSEFQKKKPSNNRWLILVVAIVVLLILLGAWWKFARE